MVMNFKLYLYTDVGTNIISILLGIGLTSLFQKVCKGKNCIIFTSPVISDVDGKIFKHDNKCYKYDISTVKCDKSKQIIEISKNLPKPPPTASVFDNVQSLKNMWTSEKIIK